MTWRVAKSILTLHEQLRRGAPRAAPPATSPDSWGTLGNVLHDTTSDHAPHDFPGWGNDIVTAGDFPNALALGLDAHRVLDDIRRARDARAKYGISNDQIFSNHPVTQDGTYYPAWEWRPYLPHDPKRDRHYEHGHLSVVGDARADGTQPWPTIGAPAAAAGKDDDDMGASFGPIDIREAGFTSLSIPPVQEGAADPRPAWINVTNDAPEYALRVWYGKGTAGSFQPLGPGLFKLKGGERWSYALPKGTCVITIKRMAINAAGEVVEATAELPAYAGHLTCCIERGSVGSAG